MCFDLILIQPVRIEQNFSHFTKIRNMYTYTRGVVPGGAGGAMVPPEFGRSVNPISTRGDRLCPPNYYWHPRIFRPSDGPVHCSSAVQCRCENSNTKICVIILIIIKKRECSNFWRPGLHWG